MVDLGYGDGALTASLAQRWLEPADYLDALRGAGLTPYVWATTSLHVLTGPNPVLRRVSGTVLRPVLAALDEEAAEPAA